MLLEKKQEISPEDEKDNKLLRSLLYKLSNSNYSDITDEEEQAAKRNGFKINKSYDRLDSVYGYVDADYYGVSSPFNSPTGMKNGKLSKDVNIADVGRKRIERAKRYSDTDFDSFKVGDVYGSNDSVELNDLYKSKPEDFRGARKKRIRFDGITQENSSNIENYDRELKNLSLQRNYRKLKHLSKKRNDLNNDIGYLYDNEEEERKDIIRRINDLKYRLSRLSDDTDAQVTQKRELIKQGNKTIKDFLDNRRKQIADKKKKQGETKND